MISIKIDTKKCKGCHYCILVCKNKVLEIEETQDRHGNALVRVKNPKACTGCGMCALMCPDCAIKISKES